MLLMSCLSSSSCEIFCIVLRKTFSCAMRRSVPALLQSTDSARGPSRTSKHAAYFTADVDKKEEEESEEEENVSARMLVLTV
jgi:hypothetical protein